MSRSPKTRFESKYRVNLDTGCWDWTSPLHRGYGRFWDGTAVVLAHVFSHGLHTGKVPDGLYPLHKCGNRKCVNPDHLFLGSPVEYAADLVVKGYQSRRRGSAHTNSQLTGLQVQEARELFTLGTYTQKFLGKMFGVNQSTISKILACKAWGHV